MAKSQKPELPVKESLAKVTKTEEYADLKSQVGNFIIFKEFSSE